ncbi:RAMP superfamily CRISPR-associated protein [Gloeobacter morelensis]|uniref:Type III-B CRISPR module RAMP protein Cmr4 n=1 Tax=Gloeobacter morelensis MG652769 TaxID=2781736 RepID=A0ABY3PIU4_9CYAN|nr:RAMP superfamily CRISPR-associated protein [Gloeobacter morelensis]UFP93586.1 type III-B CRISPR module RAMP protein Cmr4 [Gloeobacter morelensis MG652769]
MYRKAYGIIETLAPVHVGATAGEESGNLNLIFRDQFLQTGIIPGSSIRGRLRADMRRSGEADEEHWYGRAARTGETDSTSESIVKFEYASIVWLPVFCPGQPVVWVSCPRLLERYRRIVGITEQIPEPYTGSSNLQARQGSGTQRTLFFNLGFLTVEHTAPLGAWFPNAVEKPAAVVADNDMAMIHDMALYRQSRVALDEDEKKVKGGAFFNVEALPEGTILIFPVALKPVSDAQDWQPFEGKTQGEIYLGGLESVGFGHCRIDIKLQNPDQGANL